MAEVTVGDRLYVRYCIERGWSLRAALRTYRQAGARMRTQRFCELWAEELDRQGIQRPARGRRK